MDPDLLKILWAGFFSVLGAAVASLGPKVFERLWPARKKEQVAVEEAATRAHAVLDHLLRNIRGQEVLDAMRRDTRGNRVLLLCSHNGGGVPKLGSPVYISVVLESHDEHLPSIREEVQRRSFDGPYEELLAAVVDKKSAVLETTDLETGCQLRTIYEAQGITQSHVYLVRISKDLSILYLSIQFTDPDMKITANEQRVLDAGLAKLTNIFDLDFNLEDLPKDLQL